MSILTILIIAACAVLLFEGARLLFATPDEEQRTLAELEREMTTIAAEWALAVEQARHGLNEGGAPLPTEKDVAPSDDAEELADLPLFECAAVPQIASSGAAHALNPL